MANRVWIPEVSEERLQKLGEQIKKVKDPSRLKPLCDITTHHNFASNGLNNPTDEEVLAAISQVSANVLFKAMAWKMIEPPTTVGEAGFDGYQTARVRLYQK